jgi:hypothetical protein
VLEIDSLSEVFFSFLFVALSLFLVCVVADPIDFEDTTSARHEPTVRGGGFRVHMPDFKT